MHVSLRAGEKIYVNGAVLRVDRKVSLELMNDVTFLLEAHVMKVEDATTPLRQLYFIVQIMLMNPTGGEAARDMFDQSMRSLLSISKDAPLAAGLRAVESLVDADRAFEALKAIRALFSLEDEILRGVLPAKPTQAA